MAGTSSTTTSRVIAAPIETVFAAFMDPEALEIWMCPGGMTGKIHEFDGRVGGGYRMSSFYSSTAAPGVGKTADREDRYPARYLELDAPTRIVQAIEFDSPSALFSGEMRMEVRLVERGRNRTEVTIVFKDIPAGIRPEDNDAGTRSSLEKLARYVE